MEMYLKVNGKMIRQMVMEFIIMQMDRFMKDIGKMIFKKDMVQKNGQMVLDMKVTINKDKNMAMALIFGMMVQYMKEVGQKIKFMEMYF